MSLSALHHKVNYIKERASPYAQHELEAYFHTLYGHLAQEYAQPTYLRSNLYVDLFYIALRHHMWLEHHLLSEAAIAYLGQAYKLPHAMANALTAGFFVRALDYLPTSGQDFFRSNDKNFFLYIFVTALTARDNRELITDLGLGTPLLQRLQQAAKHLGESQKQEETQVYFDSHYEEAMVAAITELSTKKIDLPWAADHYRLLFHTVAMAAPLGVWIEQGGVSSLFDFLLTIGEHGGLTVNEGAQWFAGQGPTADSPAASLDGCTLLFNELMQRQLFISSPVPLHKSSQSLPHHLKGQGTTAGPYYHLSPLGFEYTADAFAHRHRDKLWQADVVAALSGPWQAAYFRHMPLAHRDHIKWLLAQNVRLHPDAIEQAAGKLSCNAETKELFFELAKMAKSQVPTIRAAVCRVLGQLKGWEQVSAELSKLAINDGSALVRDTALEQLRRELPAEALTVYRQTPLAAGKIA